MSKAAIAAALTIIAAAGVTGGVLLSQKKTTSSSSSSSTTPPPSSDYTVAITGPTSTAINISNTYTVTVLNNGEPVANAAVTLNSDSGTTNAGGIANFVYGFTASGSYTLTAVSEGVSSSITVTVSQPQCSGNTGCPAGYNCINGSCVELIPAQVILPLSPDIPAGYVQRTREVLECGVIVVKEVALLTFPSGMANTCPKNYSTENGSMSYNISFSIKGSVVDSSQNGINGISVDVSISIDGGGTWEVTTGGGDIFSGTANPSLASNTVTTDSNGNFTVDITVSNNVDTKLATTLGILTDVNTKWYKMPIPNITLTATQGSLSADSIISLSEYISSHQCTYYNYC